VPYTELYALPLKHVKHYVKEVRQILEGDLQRVWPSLFKSFESFRPPPLLSTMPLRAKFPPLTQVSFHASPSLGWTDITADEIPRTDDPRVQWLLRQIVLGTVDCVFKGRDDKFNAAFCIWIPDQGKFQNAEEQAHHEWWCQTLFYSQAPMPADMPFLESPGNYRALWTPEMVHECAERERRTSFLTTLAPRLEGEWYGDLVASELRRIVKFIEFVEADGSALYYHECAS
jgi:hypothetical protein